MPTAPTYADILAARERLRPHAVLTPLISHPTLDAHAGGRVLLKAESLQRVGAFKFRGAYNAISQIDPEAAPGGVVACSSGNHAQGVAAAATLCGLKSLIVMPADAPALKIARTKAFGAEVVLYDRVTGDRDAIAHALCEERGAAFVHPFDDARVIAGQGTVGLEIMEQARHLGFVPNIVAIGCSGGGLIAGCSIAIEQASPATEIYAVEPQGFDDLARSLASGVRERNDKASGSICDALLAPTIGRTRLQGGIVVSDDEVRAAMRFAFHELKLVVEPGGAVSLAAILAGKLETRNAITVAVLTGGNVDPETFAGILKS
jgi:threonine dehydratase